jgi:hypothetical protein
MASDPGDTRPDAGGAVVTDGALEAEPAPARRLIGGIPAREEEPIPRHLPLRAGGTFELWVEVPDAAALVAVVRAARAEKLAVRPVPPFSDAMPPEGGLTGVGLRLGVGFEEIRPGEGGLWVGAAVPLALLGLRTGFVAFARAPGTLADAWDEGWIAPAILRVRRFRGRSVEEVEGAEPDAKSLVVEALVKPGAKVTPPAAGRAFKEHRRRNLPPLRDLMRGLGLGGLRLGGAVLAEDDPTVLANRGEASPRQLRLLLQAARERIHTATGLEIDDRMAPPGRGGRL